MAMSGRDATREFEDVGHSMEARSRLDGLVIGSVRSAADDEQRTSRTGRSSSRKAAVTMSLSRTAIYDWVNGHVTLLRRVGTIGVAGAAVLATAVILRRYGARMSWWDRR